MRTRNFSVILLLVFILTVTVSMYVSACPETPLCTDDSWSEINCITDDNTVHSYRLDLPGDGKLDITLQSWISYINFKLWDKDLTKTYFDTTVQKGSINEPATGSQSIYLKGGIYFLEVYQYSFNLGSKETKNGEYRLKTVFTNGYTNELEANDTAQTALEIMPGSIQTSLMWDDDEYDYYKLTLHEPGTLKLSVKSWMTYINMGIRNADFMEAADINGEIIKDMEISRGSEKEPASKIYEFSLDKGTWYIFFKKYMYNIGRNETKTGIYSITWLSED